VCVSVDLTQPLSESDPNTNLTPYLLCSYFEGFSTSVSRFPTIRPPMYLDYPDSSNMRDRKKAPPFHESELKLLMQLYCDSYEEYHGRGRENGKNGGQSDKKNLLRRFAKEVSNLGFYQRTEKQIEERLRADCKRVRKHERARSHEGQEAVLNSLPTYLHQLYECRKNKANGSGLLGLC
ncbi:hypothetical protein OSTOST_24423, partial [Ostertagia ostertagi]